MNKNESKEKIQIGSAINFWETKGSKKYHIKQLRFNDGPHGVRATKSADIIVTDNLLSTCFPTLSSVASTFNKKLVRQLGDAIGKEAKMHQVDVLLGPGINLKRTPLGGRNFEYFSEDGFLTSELAIEYVNGLQQNHIAACLKHFIANEQEVERMTINCVIDEMTLFDTYLKPFKRIIEHSNPATIMSSYNKVNGTKVSESTYLLNDVLRKKLHFNGAIISDWGAINSPVNGFQASVDFDMPFMGEYQTQECIEALEKNKITVQQVQDRFQRIKVLSDFIERDPAYIANMEQHDHLARLIAQEAIVLLENKENILPLTEKDSIKVVETKVLESFRIQGSGSSKVSPYIVRNLKEELETAFQNQPFRFIRDNELHLIRKKDKVLIFVGLSDLEESEGIDRPKIELDSKVISLIQQVNMFTSNVIVINNAGTAVGFLDASFKGLLHTGLPGQAGVPALIDILQGNVNPSGKLSETFPVSTTQLAPATPSKISQTELLYSEGTLQGYKYYDAHKIPVKYPFGYGKYYGKLTYINIHFEQKDTLRYTITISNNSRQDIKEVLQVYFGYQEQGVLHPVKELCFFEKIELKANSNKIVQLEIPVSNLMKYDTKIKKYLVKPGKYTLFLGTSVQDILAVNEMEVSQSDTYIKYYLESLDDNTLCKEYLHVEKSKTVFESHFSYLKEMGLYEIILDMPLKLIGRLFPNMVQKERIKNFLNELNTVR